MPKSLKQALHLQKLNANQKSENNRNWRGEDVSYKGLHRWIRDHLPRPELCESCNIRPSREVANLDGEYSRDLNTWAWLCRSCHLVMDDVAGKAWITKRSV